MGQITTRRSFLKALGFAAAGTTVSTVAVAEVANPIFVKVASPSFSVPPETMQAIKEWRVAHRASVKASNAYAEHLSESGKRCWAAGRDYIFPDDKVKLDQLSKVHIEAAALVGPAREKMIVALLNAE